MYSPKNRLFKADDFLKVKRFGRQFNCQFFKLYLVQSSEEGTKIGFIVSNEVGNAVERNRIKRRLRALFSPWLGLKVGFSLVVIGRRSTLEAMYHDLLVYRDKAAHYYKLRLNL